MLALKGLGCLLIVLSGYVFSRSRLMRESVSIGRLRSLKELLRAIGSRIENYCMPTDEILSELPPELFYSCGYGGMSVFGRWRGVFLFLRIFFFTWHVV